MDERVIQIYIMNYMQLLSIYYDSTKNRDISGSWRSQQREVRKSRAVEYDKGSSFTKATMGNLMYNLAHIVSLSHPPIDSIMVSQNLL
jgi:hypothetical protein